MSVSLGSDYRGVSEKGADNIEIHASLNQAGGEGVPAGVENNVRAEAQVTGSLLKPHGQAAVVNP